MFSIHPLVHSWIRERPSSSHRGSRLRATRNHESNTTEEPVVRYIFGLALMSTDKTTESGLRFRRELYLHVESFKKAYPQILEIWDTEIHSLPVSKEMGWISEIYKSLGKYKDAEKLNVKALEIKKRVLGDENPNTLIYMSNLALLNRRQGKYENAEKLNLKSLETRKRVLGDEHPDTLISMSNLASAYNEQGKYKDAEKLSVKALEIMERVLGDKHPLTLISMSNLAHILMNLSRTVEAIEMMQRAARLQNKVLGAEHRSTKGSYQTFAEWTAEHNAAISFDTDSDGAETDTEID